MEFYREHEKFRKQLENMADTSDQVRETPVAATPTPAIAEEPVDDGFLQVTPVPVYPEEEKKETK